MLSLTQTVALESLKIFFYVVEEGPYYYYRLYLNYLFIYLYLAVLSLLCCTGSSLVAVSRGYRSLQCVGFSLWWLLLLQSTGSRAYGLQ